MVTISNAGNDTEKLDHAYIACEHVKWYSHSEKQFGSFFSKKKHATTI